MEVEGGTGGEGEGIMDATVAVAVAVDRSLGFFGAGGGA